MAPQAPETNMAEKLDDIKKQLSSIHHDSIKGSIGAMNDMVTQIEWYERRLAKGGHSRVLQQIQDNKVIDYVLTFWKSSRSILNETKDHAPTDKDAVLAYNNTLQLHVIIQMVMRFVLDCYVRAETEAKPGQDANLAEMHLKKAEEARSLGLLILHEFHKNQAERYGASKSELSEASIMQGFGKGTKRPRDDESPTLPAKIVVLDQEDNSQKADTTSTITGRRVFVRHNDKFLLAQTAANSRVSSHRPERLDLGIGAKTTTQDDEGQERPFQEDWTKLDQLAKDNPHPDRQTQDKMLSLVVRLLPTAERYYSGIMGSPTRAALPSQEILEQRYPGLKELQDKQKQANSDILDLNDKMQELETKLASLKDMAPEEMNDEQKRQAILYDFSLQKLQQGKEKALEVKELVDQGIAIVHAVVASESAPSEATSEQSLGFPDDGEAMMVVLQLRKLQAVLRELLVVGDRAVMGYCISPKAGKTYAFC